MFYNYCYGYGCGSGCGSGYGYGDGYGSGSGSGDGYDDGSGYGDGSGSGCGCGDGYGSGSGSGSGYGSGSGSGDGSGSGYGSGYGSGSGSGYGYSDGSGSGYGSGYGSGIKSFDRNPVYSIDGIQTIITYIKDDVAKGYILNSTFTLSPCVVVKSNGYFAHGKDLREAQESLHEKIFENMDSDEAIDKFIETFEHDKKYSGKDFFDWHHYLTGSCLMGRESFVKNRGLSLNELYTVNEFIDICKDSYGSKIIKQLKEKWNKEKEN